MRKAGYVKVVGGSRFAVRTIASQDDEIQVLGYRPELRLVFRLLAIPGQGVGRNPIGVHRGLLKRRVIGSAPGIAQVLAIDAGMLQCFVELQIVLWQLLWSIL